MSNTQQRDEEMKPGQIAWKQISIHTKMACGARKARLTDANTVQFQVHSKPQRYIAVAYDEGADLYNIEYFRIKRGSYDRISLETATGVYCDMMSETIYHMVNK